MAAVGSIFVEMMAPWLPAAPKPRVVGLGAFESEANKVAMASAAMAKVKLLTLAIVQQEGRVLLGMKKRGFGEGYFNGFGGKVEDGETIEQAAARELEEEAGITPEQMDKRGILTFHFDDKPVLWEVHVYLVQGFAGNPCETDEMCPRWFSTEEIPFDKMWKDDPIWYPHLLQGSMFRGSFVFQNTHDLISHSFEIVSAL